MTFDSPAFSGGHGAVLGERSQRLALPEVEGSLVRLGLLAGAVGPDNQHQDYATSRPASTAATTGCANPARGQPGDQINRVGRRGGQAGIQDPKCAATPAPMKSGRLRVSLVLGVGRD